MKYSKYFGIVFKTQGIPKISVTQMQRLMNIVSLEGQIDGMRKKKPEPDNNIHHDKDIWKKERQLTMQTGNQKPKDLMEEMFRMSID